MNISGNGHARKSPEQLEREIDEERAHINHTLDILEGKLSPGEIFDKVLGYTRKNSGEFSRNLVNTVTHNPIPTLMTAIGISWMLYQQNRSGSSSSYASGVDEWDYGVSSDIAGSDQAGLKERAANLKDSAANVKHRASDAAHQASEDIRQRADRVKHSTQAQAQKVSQGFHHMLEEQPLAMGALGIAIGALIGSSLPSTRQEDRLMGEVSDRAADKATHAAERTYEKAAEAGEKVKDDVKAESRPAL